MSRGSPLSYIINKMEEEMGGKGLVKKIFTENAWLVSVLR